MKKNRFWAVYNKNMRVVAIGSTKRTVMQEALTLSNYRWTYDTLRDDWKMLKRDGYRVLKSKIQPACSHKSKLVVCNFCSAGQAIAYEKD